MTRLFFYFFSSFKCEKNREILVRNCVPVFRVKAGTPLTFLTYNITKSLLLCFPLFAVSPLLRGSFLAGFAQESLVTLLRGSFLAGFAQEMLVTLLRYYGVFPCRLCSRNVCYVIMLLRGLSLPALLKKFLLRYYVITGSFLAGFAQEMLVTLLRYYGVFPCRLCSRNFCYVITLLRGLSLPALLKKCLLRYYVITGSFLAGFAQEMFVTLLRYYGVFPCRLCSRNVCYVITLLRGLSLPALLKKCLLRYYVITGSFLAGFAQEMLVTLLRYYGVFPCRLCSRNACYVITLLQPSFVAGFAQGSLVTLLRYYGVFPCRLCSRNACYVITEKRLLHCFSFSSSKIVLNLLRKIKRNIRKD